MLRKVFSCALCFLLIAALPAAFLSCSNIGTELSAADDTPTLRYTADRLYDSTTWTEEVEVDRLTAKVSSVSGVSSKLNLSPLIVVASVPAEDSRIFPSLGSFGSLDTTLISESLREMLVSFAECVAGNRDADSFMAEESLFSLALFYADFSRIFGDCFGLGGAEEQSPDETGKLESPEPDGGEAASAGLEEKLYFDSFVLGQPFLDGIYYEVPLKFFSGKATLTLTVFCFESSGSWRIDQLQISDWEIF